MLCNALNCKPVIAHIDLASLKHNYQIVKNKAPTSKLLAVVKSNAYGHGIVPIAKALLPQADAFGVAWLDDAIRLRENGITKPILLMKGILTREELQLVDELNLSMVVHNFSQIELLEKTPLTHPIHMWLKIDTGMHRLGFQANLLPTAYEKLISNSKVAKPLAFITHFSDSDDVSNPKTNQQIDCFNQLTKNLTGIKCMANSGAITGWPATHIDWVRSGILLYGASPLLDKQAPELGLRPVMTLTSKLLTIQHLKQGDQVGYSSTWTCPEDMPVGIVNLGYGDGYPRHAPSGTPTLVNNTRCQTIGRVSMDMVAVDLRPCPQANIGDEVILWGKGLPIEEVANKAETIPHELFCRLTQRVYFQYHD